MKKLKRDPVKYIRDKAKSKYNKGSECYICGVQNELDFHHFYTLAPLLQKWLKQKQKEQEKLREMLTWVFIIVIVWGGLGYGIYWLFFK